MEKVYSVIIALLVSFVSVTSGTVKPPDVAKTEKPAETAVVEAPVEAPVETPKQVGYGRILLVGDSRSVDMFSADEVEIYGANYNGITVCCRNAAGFNYLKDTIADYGTENFDTLLTLMGCNSYGNFSDYGPFYDSLLAQGKTIVVGTVGPTVDEYLASDFDKTHYEAWRQVQFNNSLIAWANEKGVKIIDLYSYINNNPNIYVSPEDGIHFFPQPTTEMWNYIRANLN